MTIHKELALGKWFQLSLIEQLANIGSEIERTIIWKNKNIEYSNKAFERAIELLDITIADPKNKKRLREILRVREALFDNFVFDNEYNSTYGQWKKYFFHFGYASAIRKGK
jgi:uncharacterized HAD superfamily protein